MNADSAHVYRQALSGLLWSKQFYHFNVHQWLQGDPAYPPPPTERQKIRNSGWTHMHCLYAERRLSMCACVRVSG